MPRKNSFLIFFLPVALLLIVLQPQGHPEAAAGTVLQEATTNQIVLEVVSARTEPDADNGPVIIGDPVTTYGWMINQDNTGDPFDSNANCYPLLEDGVTRNPDYPDGCEQPGLRTVPGWSWIKAHGDETELNQTTAITLEDGKYLISVTADGYKLDGEHFTVPMPDPDGDGKAVVKVRMHPLPLPPATMVIKVFNDAQMTNGQFDGVVEEYDPAEPESFSNHMMDGFRASIHDIAGEVTTDVFGNPLCTIYQKDINGNIEFDGDGNPIIGEVGQGCFSDQDGNITIPNIGPLRYDVLIFPPSGDTWVQTTTLEGSQGWDTWLQEAGTGLDNEFLIAAEPSPWTMFGFVRPLEQDLGGTGTIKGVIMAAATYWPTEGGLSYQGSQWTGFAGTKLHRPIGTPWLTLNDLNNGDTAIWVGQGNPDGSFEISGVPEGNYFLTYWDEKQHYILDFVQVTVDENEEVDIGLRMLTGWFTEVSGNVFLDDNGNGRQDPGEPGIPNYVVVLKDRDNTEIDRMSIAATTQADGFYELEKSYPMGSWMILEAYSDLYYTTGLTYQTLNMPEEKTLLGPIVDIGFLPVLGQPVRLDWGVQPYAEDENGGIAGTVFYDTVRAEDDARYAGVEPWQPGIPGLTLNLYQAQVDPATGEPLYDTDGSILKGQFLMQTETETFKRPTGCEPLNADGEPLDVAALPLPEADKPCVEGPMASTSIGDGQNDLDGNWGFGEGCFGAGGYDAENGVCADGNPPASLPPGKYLVEVVIPEINVGGVSKPLYTPTREEDLNIFDGDTFFPEIPPPACAGAIHTVDVADDLTDAYPPQDTGLVDYNGNPISTSVSTPVENPNFAAEGGSRFEGRPMPLCDVKYVELTNGKAVAPVFNLFTDVPIPGKWKGYIIDNLNVSVDPTTLFYGEMAGVPNVPIGLYDYTGRLVHTMHSDRNGVYEVLLPSTGTFNAASPAGMFANVYYQYGNDPGPIDNPNEHYNPQYRSIGTSFEIYPGTIVPADLAPTQNGGAIWSPTTSYDRLALCRLEPTVPQLFAVSKPYGSAGTFFTIDGTAFGDQPGMVGQVRFDETPVEVLDWSDNLILARVPAEMASGAYQLSIVNNIGETTVNGITYHVLGAGYNPAVYEVGPGWEFDPAVYDTTMPLNGNPDGADAYVGPIQAAINAAWAEYDEGEDTPLVVVYPGVTTLPANTANTEFGLYIENPVIYSPVQIQGIGPGGSYPDSTGIPPVYGTIIDGRGVGGDTPYTTWWRNFVTTDIWNNRGQWDRALMVEPDVPRIYEGAVISVYGSDGEFDEVGPPRIDGLIIQGGDQQGFPNQVQLNEPGPGQDPIPAMNVVVQGGGIFVNGYGSYLQISNNVIRSNGGSYGAAIRLGTPHIAEADGVSNHNDNVVIAHNQIVSNGGVNLAGGIGIFNGADNYEVAYNYICGNSSIEYGGGISHYGFSPNGAIHHNWVVLNSSYDEGGGIMIAGELPTNPATLSPGAGPVDIYNNLIQSNVANDDGGGLRFLMANNFEFNVYNNVIANNVSTHEGGGISLNDAPNVVVTNNTIVKNMTTATALTSNGQPAPAGLSSSRNSVPMQNALEQLDPAASIFSDPIVVNNVFWDNRAATWTGNELVGLGLDGVYPVQNWDLGVADNAGTLSPRYSMMQVAEGSDPSNILGADPQFREQYTTTIRILPWRGNFNFVGINIVAVDAPVGQQGDYQLMPSSAAIDDAELGACPADDFAGLDRPLIGNSNDVATCDMGAFELLPRYYVDHAATGANTGLNWADAFTDLQSALTAVGSGWEVWVAEGTYKPTTSPTDRSASFHLHSGAQVYGGFAGTENAVAERDWVAHPTILSGDLESPYYPAGNLLDNSYHVVDASGTDTGTVLDGFTITAGYASGTANRDYTGGAVHIFTGSPTLRNLVFYNNHAKRGAAVNNEAGSNATLINVAFRQNMILGIVGNGIVRNWASSTITVNNATFADNNSYDDGIIYSRVSHADLTNVIIYGNQTNGQPGIKNDNRASSTTSFSIVQGCGASGSWLCGGDGGSNIAADPQFVSVAAGNLHLLPGSPAIDTGTNSVCLASDLDGTPRPVSGSGGTTATCDMGAYELPARFYVDDSATGTNNGLSWADAFTDLHSALSAIGNASFAWDTWEIWVAEGTYKPTTSPTDRSASFHLHSGVQLYGGFAGTENALVERDWMAHPTILSGDLESPYYPAGNLLDNSYHVVDSSGADATTILDGFTITAGYASGTANRDYAGGGLHNYGGSPTLRNLVFYNNHAKRGAAVNNEAGSDATLTNVTFRQNMILGIVGNGIVRNWANSTITVNHATFAGNNSYDDGIIYSRVSHADLTNVIIYGNQTNGQPGIKNDNRASSTTSFSIVQGCLSGTGLWLCGDEGVPGSNLSNDPLFVDLAGGGLNLTNASNGVDSAGGIGCPAGDVEGTARPIDGNGDRDLQCDRGAYEAPRPAFVP